MSLERLDEALKQSMDFERYDVAIGILIATALMAEGVTEEKKQLIGEQLIELHLKMYTQAARGTKEILDAVGFDDESVREILNNAKAKSS